MAYPRVACLYNWPLINLAMAISPNALLGQYLTSPHLRWLVYRISYFRDSSDVSLWTFGICSSQFLHLRGCPVAPDEGRLRWMPVVETCQYDCDIGVLLVEME